MRLTALAFACFLVACGPGEEEGHRHGAMHDLGTQAAGTFTVAVTMFGEVEAGREVAVDVALSGSPARASAVQARLANDAGDGTVNTTLPRGEGSSFHAHIAVPEGLPEDAALWISIRGEGRTQEARFELPD